MNNKMKPIRLDFKPSKILTLIIGVICIGAIAILIPLVLNWQIKLLLGFAILSASLYAICQHGLLILPWSCVALNVNSDNILTLMLANGRQLPATLCRDSVVNPYLTVMHCKVQDAPILLRWFSRHLVLLPDMLDADGYRQLRVWLRWGQSFPI